MIRLLSLLLVTMTCLSVPLQAADDVGAAARGVVRVVTVAMVDGEVVGFGHGSGVAVSPTRIVTNAHVVDSAVRYPANVAVGVVPSEGQKSYAAKLIAVDAKRDLALIELSEGRLPAAAIFTGPIAAIAASTAPSSRSTSSGKQRLQGRSPAARAAVPSVKKRTLPRAGCRAAQLGRQ
jgi:S1-C subfamily serine protease